MSQVQTTVRDGRIAPFSYVTHDAMAAIHSEFVDHERAMAMAMYLALAVQASLERAHGNPGGFQCPRTQLASDSGLSEKTIERFTPRLISAGLLVVERRPGRPNLWMLVEPGQVKPDPRPEDGGNPRLGDGTPPTGGRDTPDCQTGVSLTRERQGIEEVKNEEEREARAPELCSRIERHVRTLDEHAPGELASSPRWQHDATQLLTERPANEVFDVFEWASGNAFWSCRVLCPDDLNRFFTRIVAARAGETTIAKRDVAHDTRRKRVRDEKLANGGTCCLEPGSAPTAAEAAWAELAPELRKALGAEPDGTGRDIYDLWFYAAHAHAGEHGELLLAVPPVAEGWIRDRFSPTIDQLTGRHIDIVICEEAA